jgi:hypothetical protein
LAEPPCGCLRAAAGTLREGEPMEAVAVRGILSRKNEWLLVVELLRSEQIMSSQLSSIHRIHSSKSSEFQCHTPY